MDGTSKDAFTTIFILNDSAKTWLVYYPDIGGSPPVCAAPQCTLTYGPKAIVATAGKLARNLDRETGEFRSVDLKGTTAMPEFAGIVATCHSIPMPIPTGPKTKF